MCWNKDSSQRDPRGAGSHHSPVTQLQNPLRFPKSFSNGLRSGLLWQSMFHINQQQ